MGTTTGIKTYQDLVVYQKAKLLTTELIRYFSKVRISRSEEFLYSQLYRASSSIGANLAEGFGRNYSGSFRQFVSIARGSAFEVEYWLEVMIGLGEFDQLTLENFISKDIEICKMLSGLMSKMKGVAKN